MPAWFWGYSAVTAACLVLRRAAFDAIDGYDEGYAVCYNDVDLCLRLLERGYRNLWTPDAELYHNENVSHAPRKAAADRRYWREVRQFVRRWGHLLLRDPAHHPHLALEGSAWVPGYPR